MVKDPSANAGDLRDTGSISGVRKIPWRRAWQPTPVFLVGDSHGQRSLMDYSLPPAIAHSVAKSWTQLRRLSRQAGAFNRFQISDSDFLVI